MKLVYDCLKISCVYTEGQPLEKNVLNHLLMWVIATDLNPVLSAFHVHSVAFTHQRAKSVTCYKRFLTSLLWLVQMGYKVQVHTPEAWASNQPLTTYFPFAHNLLVMNKVVQRPMKRKFGNCYVMAKENLSFHKYPALHQLEECHGVHLGFENKTVISAQTFTHYIPERQ